MEDDCKIFNKILAGTASGIEMNQYYFEVICGWQKNQVESTGKFFWRDANDNGKIYEKLPSLHLSLDLCVQFLDLFLVSNILQLDVMGGSIAEQNATRFLNMYLKAKTRMDRLGF